MARPHRINEAGQVVHITARVVERTFRFSEDGGAWGEAYIALLQKCLRDFEMSAFAFCLMGNHIHLLVRQTTPEHTISDFMQVLQGTFARRYNRAKSRHGHFWESRFHMVVLTSAEALLRVATYIHLNPVRAGMTSRAEDYRWSSARAWLGLESPHSGWIELPSEYESLARDEANRGPVYRKHLEASWEYALRSRKPAWTQGLVIGSKERVMEYVRARRGILRIGRRWSPRTIEGTSLWCVRAA